jgi:hypothetical protein
MDFTKTSSPEKVTKLLRMISSLKVLYQQVQHVQVDCLSNLRGLIGGFIEVPPTLTKPEQTRMKLHLAIAELKLHPERVRLYN